MGTGTGSVALAARDTGYPCTHYLARAITFSSTANNLVLGILPAGAVVHRISIDVNTAFNDSGTEQVRIGTTNGGAEIMALTSVTSTGVAAGTRVAGYQPPTVDTVVYVQYVGQNSDATTGAATVIVEFIPRAQ